MRRERMFPFLSAVLLLCLCFLSSAASAEPFALIQTESGEGTTFRPQTGGQDLHLPDLDWAEVLERESGECLVRLSDGRTGYVPEEDLRIQEIVYAAIGYVKNPTSDGFLNLRSEPRYTSSVLGRYYNGVPCTLISGSDGWLHVQVDGLEGYFLSEFVDIVTSPQGQSWATVTLPSRSCVNLRSGPGYAWPALRQYPSGAYVTVLAEGREWWMVSDAHTVGFMQPSFLSRGIVSPNPDTLYEAASSYAVVTNPRSTQVLHLRLRPTRKSESLGQYSNGARLTILSQGLEWCLVQTWDGQTGYMMTEFLTLYNAMDVPEKTVVHPEGTFANLREGPSLESGVLCEVPHGARVTVIWPDDQWYRVQYEEYSGYISVSFLQ